MATDNIKITVKSTNKVITVAGNQIKLTKKMQEQLGNKKLLVKEEMKIAQEVRDHITKNIAQGKRYDTGGNVKKLAPSTIKRKGNSDVLFDTGKMVHGVVYRREGGKTVVKMKPYTYKNGAKLTDVMKWTNEGTDKMPARPVFGINKTNTKKIVDKVIKEKLKK